ncbi:MAG TPA: hypothetical protein PKW55_05650 [Spirochaetota bacterium]|nr:hypothetical protein [Spirochaetota bacterium]HOM37564.1 hypothetical protein [Spirochaetota bacterium]HPQ49465.1 hypothetical protein [Spirochaetota bacterium]
MERLDELLYKLGENKRNNPEESINPNFTEKTIEIIKRKKRDFFIHSALIFAIFILITYISGLTLTSVKHNMNSLKIYIFLSLSFFLISFTLFWIISNERLIEKFINKFFGKNFVNNYINNKKCHFTE